MLLARAVLSSSITSILNLSVIRENVYISFRFKMWSSGLLKTMKDPKYVLYSDDKIVIIKDMYPKAKYHFLVLPQEEISDIKKVEAEHVSLLKHMERKGKEIAENIAPGVIFRYGYHARPSMHRLHLHVISIDMISDALKTKKHYNSFVTEFFLLSKDVINDLENQSKISIPSSTECDTMLDRNLKCHICQLPQRNMPKLKQHLLIHV